MDSFGSPAPFLQIISAQGREQEDGPRNPLWGTVTLEFLLGDCLWNQFKLMFLPQGCVCHPAFPFHTLPTLYFYDLRNLVCVYAHECIHMCVYVCGSACIHVCVRVSTSDVFFLELGLFEPGFLTVSGLCKEAGLGGQRTAGITGLCPPAQRL